MLLKEVINYVPDCVLGLLRDFDCLLAGGAIIRLLNDEDKGDYDVFFNGAECRDKVKEYLKINGYSIYEYTDGVDSASKGDTKIELIYFKTFDCAEELLDTFDMNLCKVAISYTDCYGSYSTLQNIRSKLLTIAKLTDANRTMHRVLRYIERGYHYDDSLINCIIPRTEKSHDYL